METTRTAVRQSAARLAVVREDVDLAEKALRLSIQCALAHGVPATLVAEDAGISRQRVYQIRDGKR